MDNTKIILGNKRNKRSPLENSTLELNIVSEERKIPYTEEVINVDAYQQYYKEKDASDKHRLAFTVTPFCTNILFNVITEPVYKEGSDDTVVIKKDGPSANLSFNNYKNSEYLNRANVIRDTAFSHPLIGEYPLVYHCGYDIFNNHTLRRREYSVIISGDTSKSEFNTIYDIMRHDNGGNIENIKDSLPYIKYNTTQLNAGLTALHTYRYDSVYSYIEAVQNGLIENNGWFGFLNPTTLPIDNVTVGNKKFSVNKCMNNNKAWEQIDMYPDRSLYSFVPKMNKFRNRIEKNWDYCITYPYASDYDNELVTSRGGVNGLKCVPVMDITDIYALPETDTVTFKSGIRHNLVVGSYITMSFNNYTTLAPIEVLGVGLYGSDNDHYFSVRLSSIINELMRVNESDRRGMDIRFRKYEGGCEAQYYLRKFKKFETQAKSSLNKLAFSQNIYSDQVVQIVFTDDIVTSGVTDNLGRPLSEIFLTIVKRNKGHEEWYGGDTFRGEDIEYSHCFGKVSSGFDMPSDKDFKKYNVHRIHSVSTAVGGLITASEEKIEDDITIDSDEFYGDIVEFIPYKIQETSLETICHRFNTAQRETANSDYGSFVYDNIELDDYDIEKKVQPINSNVPPINGGGKTAKKANNNTKKPLPKPDTDGDGEIEPVTPSRIDDDVLPTDEAVANATSPFKVSEEKFGGVERFINIVPEGYYYKPHYRVKVREFSPEVQQGSHTAVLVTEGARMKQGWWELTLAKNYFFQVGDTVVAYKIEDEGVTKVTGTCESVMTGGGTQIIAVNFGNSADINSGMWKMYRWNPETPDGAYQLDDGTGRYLWRDVLSYSDLLPDSELYDETFTNGAHYHHENIMFYLKRQDPDGKYGIGNEPKGRAHMFSVEGMAKDTSHIEYVKEDSNNIC